ncbi:DUF2231 domain-containing protein [Streptacidiphilus carbonis]|uniref:DUF2231 domain-containing protein n=1 Tax=Streptacidiphilus carbonis TaxID=105422 RepID=UPI000694DEF1|nr:DUF2231 domain-containing protein [Streptacidiphilus carbonis]
MKLTRLTIVPPAGRAPVREALDRVEELRALDTLVAPLQRVVRGLPLGGSRDVLRGTWLGHPLHPALVQLPVGAWASAAVLDLLPGQRRGAAVLIAAGLAGVPPAALAGWVDWSEQDERQLRVGVVHAAANVTGAALYAASLAARLRGHQVRGKVLGFAGLTVVSAGGVLGGHVAYRQATAVGSAGDGTGPDFETRVVRGPVTARPPTGA